MEAKYLVKITSIHHKCNSLLNRSEQYNETLDSNPRFESNCCKIHPSLEQNTIAYS